MSDDVQRFERLPEPGSEPSTELTPSLPIEAPLVRAVRALEALKGQTDAALLLLEHCSREEAQIEATINSAIHHLNVASAACWQLTQIRSCKGQA